MSEPRDATPATSQCSALASEILYGAAAIALFMFGDILLRRKVYYLIEKHGLPVFRIGANICARKSALSGWIDSRQNIAPRPNSSG